MSVREDPPIDRLTIGERSQPVADTTEFIVVADRLPITWSAAEGWVRSPGGLVAALEAVASRRKCRWIGYVDTTDHSHRAIAGRQLLWPHGELQPLDVRQETHERALAFANSVLWPMLHGLPQRARSGATWNDLVQYNRLVADTLAGTAGVGQLVWIHDYQLAMVPYFLRRTRPDLPIGLSIHTPFDPALGSLEVADDIRRSLRCADVIGVQTSGDLAAINKFLWSGRPTRATTATVVSPVSIDSARLEADAATPLTQSLIERERRETRDRQLIVGVDRLDFTKAVTERLAAYDRAFSRGILVPDEVRIVQIAQPTRTGLPEYRKLQITTERLAHELAARWSRSDGTSPIEVLVERISRPRVMALLATADVCVVVPHRDGMNLVAKEFSVLNERCGGALLLGERAGVADELAPGSVMVGQVDPAGISDALHRALALEPSRRREMARIRAEVVRAWTSDDWASDFLSRLRTVDVSHRSRRGMTTLQRAIPGTP